MEPSPVRVPGADTFLRVLIKLIVWDGLFSLLYTEQLQVLTFGLFSVTCFEPEIVHQEEEEELPLTSHLLHPNVSVPSTTLATSSQSGSFPWGFSCLNLLFRSLSLVNNSRNPQA